MTGAVWPLRGIEWRGLKRHWIVIMGRLGMLGSDVLGRDGDQAGWCKPG